MVGNPWGGSCFVRLHLDGGGFGVRGLSGLSDEKTLIERFRTARKIIIHRSASNRTGGELSGFHQTASEMDRAVAEASPRPFASGWRKRWPPSGNWKVVGFAVDGQPRDVRVPAETKSDTRRSPNCHAKRKAPPPGQRRDHPGSAPAQGERAADLAHMLWHVGRVAVDWRNGPSDAAKRALQDMLGSDTGRIVAHADAGFGRLRPVETVLALGHQLLVRCGQNVKLLKNWAMPASATDWCTMAGPCRQETFATAGVATGGS